MSTDTTRRACLGALLGAGASALTPRAWAQDIYPSKPIRVIVPLQVGSAADVATRMVLASIAKSTKANFVIENQAGASGLLGADKIARAAPDGYTIGGITDSVLNYAVNLAEKVTFDPIGDFAPISQIANINWVLVANPNFAARTLPELIAQARAAPGKIDFASAGNGSPHHIAMELFCSANGLRMNHVPYTGATQATTDVVGGQVPIMFSAVSVVLPMLKEGKLRALAQPNDKRSALLPDVPTFTEAGAPAFNFFTWLGLYAPKGTPKPIVDRLNAEVATAVSDPAISDRLISLGFAPLASTPAQLGELTKAGYANVGKAIRNAGIKTAT